MIEGWVGKSLRSMKMENRLPLALLLLCLSVFLHDQEKRASERVMFCGLVHHRLKWHTHPLHAAKIPWYHCDNADQPENRE